MHIAIIGCGNMGGGIAKRLAKESKLFFYDYEFSKAKALEKDHLGTAHSEIADALALAEMVILAVKPQNLSEVAQKMLPHLKSETLIVSVLAGTSISTLNKTFSKNTCIRMMPNLPLIYGEGVIGMSPKELEGDNRFDIFQSLGKLYFIAEDKMDAITALGGSGPGLFFIMVDAMIKSGIAMGFSEKASADIAYQMVRGSITLLEESQKSPKELADQVASPGGTTMAGLNKLKGIEDVIKEAFLAAYQRAQELSKNI